MTKSEQAHEYADRVAKDSYPCVHGHLNCAATPSGKCVDEVLTNHEAHGGCEACDR